MSPQFYAVSVIALEPGQVDGSLAAVLLVGGAEELDPGPRDLAVVPERHDAQAGTACDLRGECLEDVGGLDILLLEA